MKSPVLLLLLLIIPRVAEAREAWEILGSKETEQFILTAEKAVVTGVILSFANDSSFTLVTTEKERSLPAESVSDLKDVLTRKMPDSKARSSGGFKPRFLIRFSSGSEHLDILVESDLTGFVVWTGQRASGGRGGMDGYRPIIKRALRRVYSESELDRVRKMPNQ